MAALNKFSKEIFHRLQESMAMGQNYILEGWWQNEG